MPDILDAYTSFDKTFIAMQRSDSTVIVSDGVGPLIFLPKESFLSADIIENESVLATSRKNGTVARAVVGGVLAGGLGAVVGAVSSGSTTTNQVNINKLALRLITDNIKYPSIELRFIDSPRIGVNRSESLYTSMLNECQKWHARLYAIIKEDNNSTNNTVKRTPRPRKKKSSSGSEA